MISVVAAICIREGRVLLSQRPPGKHLAGCWEFPGGKMEDGETPEAALERELREELDVGVVRCESFDFVLHRYPDREVLLLFYLAELDGEPTPQEDNPCKWVPVSELPGQQMPPADQDLVRRLAREFDAAGT